MTSTGVSGLFRQDGQPIPAGEDLAIIARTEEMKLWSDIQPGRTNRLKMATTFLVIGLLAAAGTFFYDDDFLVQAVVIAAVSLILFFIIQSGARRVTPDEEVVAVSRVHWPVEVLPLPDGVMLVDALRIARDENLSVKALRKPEAVTGAARGLALEVSRLNVVEPAGERHRYRDREYYGLDGKLLALLAEMEEQLGHFESVDLDLPAMEKASPLGNWVWRNRDHFSGRHAPEGRMLAANAVAPLRDSLLRMREKADAGAEALEAARQALTTLDEEMLERLEQAHAGSLELVARTYRQCQRTTFWPSFNFYAFEDEEKAVETGEVQTLQFGRIAYDPDREAWVCPSQERDVELSRAMVVNRFRDELFYPILDQFRASYHGEIQRIDRELEARIKELVHEWKVKARDLQRDAFKGVSSKKGEIRALAANARALCSKVKGLTSTLQEYRRISQQRCEEFVSRSVALQEEAERRANELCTLYDRQFEERSEEASAEQSRLAEARKQEEDARNREVVGAIGQMSAEMSSKMTELGGKMDAVKTSTDQAAQAAMLGEDEKQRMRKKDNIFEAVGRSIGFETEKDKLKKSAQAGTSELG